MSDRTVKRLLAARDAIIANETDDTRKEFEAAQREALGAAGYAREAKTLSALNIRPHGSRR